jgi:hypothetical protein
MGGRWSTAFVVVGTAVGTGIYVWDPLIRRSFIHSQQYSSSQRMFNDKGEAD